MNKIKLSVLLILTLAMSFFVFSEEKADMEKEKAAITQTALDYLEGWYDGSGERMDNALHGEFVKRGLVSISNTDKRVLDPVGREWMVVMSSMGRGKLPPDQRKIEVTILDVYNNIATVKAASAKFMDYLHLCKQDGRWKIVNVLWEPASAPPSAPPTQVN